MNAFILTNVPLFALLVIRASEIRRVCEYMSGVTLGNGLTCATFVKILLLPCQAYDLTSAFTPANVPILVMLVI